MTSTRDRQRAAARARLEKEMAERAPRPRRKRRQRQAVIGAGVALVLVVGGVIWLVTALGDDNTPTDAAAGDQPAAAPCPWTRGAGRAAAPRRSRTSALPPTTTPPNTGTELMTIDTNLGPIEVTMDLAKAPCSAEASATWRARSSGTTPSATG